MLILQGERDYQATVADDLAGWEAGLAGRTDVTIRVYDADNHLFFPGTGRPTPAEYEPAQHVDPAVIADIASWLASVARALFPDPCEGGWHDRGTSNQARLPAVRSATGATGDVLRSCV
jgi:hypothetical protein